VHSKQRGGWAWGAAACQACRGLNFVVQKTFQALTAKLLKTIVGDGVPIGDVATYRGASKTSGTTRLTTQRHISEHFTARVQIRVAF
jgi:hypothetical protein